MQHIHGLNSIYSQLRITVSDPFIHQIQFLFRFQPISQFELIFGFARLIIPSFITIGTTQFCKEFALLARSRSSQRGTTLRTNSWHSTHIEVAIRLRKGSSNRRFQAEIC
jgi:hypothetical protein